MTLNKTNFNKTIVCLFCSEKISSAVGLIVATGTF